MQSFIRKKRHDNDQKWIFQLIDGVACPGTEQVYITTDEWLLCEDIHIGTDQRFIVVFKDKSLQSIRDLRAKHIPMLENVQKMTQDFLRDRFSKKESRMYKLYFHYIPSVFQLHLHVSIPNSSRTKYRAHPLHIVIRNIAEENTWYQNALILTTLTKQVRSKSIYTTTNIS